MVQTGDFYRDKAFERVTFLGGEALDWVTL